MSARPIRTEHRIWDAAVGSFVSAGVSIGGGPTQPKGRPPQRPRSPIQFLKGPVPWPWIAAASALPGSSLVVGLCLWRLAGAKRSNTISLGNAELVSMGIDRAAKSRAISALEGAGLIEVHREAGRFPRVTLTGLPEHWPPKRQSR
jgi:hypothetical protein